MPVYGHQVGNPWTDAYYNNLGATDFWYTHDLISDQAHAGVVKNCDFATDSPVDYGDASPLCNAALNETSTDLQYIDNYNIYAPYCNNIVANNTLQKSKREAKEVKKTLKLRSFSLSKMKLALDLYHHSVFGRDRALLDV